MNPIRRLAAALAGLAAALLTFAAAAPAALTEPLPPGPPSAPANWPRVDCRISSQPDGTWVAVCNTSSTSTTTCNLVPLPATPSGYLRQWPAPHGQQWAAIDCPGPYPFGGVTLMPGSRR